MAYSFTEAELAAADKITLGGKTYAIPQMAPRQMRIIIPAMREFPTFSVAQLAAEHFDRLVDILHASLSRAYPEMKRDDVEDLPIAIEEWAPAMATIAKASGLKARVAASGEG